MSIKKLNNQLKALFKLSRGLNKDDYRKFVTNIELLKKDYFLQHHKESNTELLENSSSNFVNDLENIINNHYLNLKERLEELEEKRKEQLRKEIEPFISETKALKKVFNELLLDGYKPSNAKKEVMEIFKKRLELIL